jgi:hypothetical protein
VVCKQTHESELQKDEDIFEDDEGGKSSNTETFSAQESKDSDKENSDSEFEEKKVSNGRGRRTTAKTPVKKTTPAKKATVTKKKNITKTTEPSKIVKHQASISPSGPIRRLGLSKLNVPKGPPSPVRLPNSSNPPILK